MIYLYLDSSSFLSHQHSSKSNLAFCIVDGEMSVCGCELDTEAGTNEIIVDVVAGPIWSDDDAKVKCPIVCASYGGEWTGNWVTPQETWGKMSKCECKFKF